MSEKEKAFVWRDRIHKKLEAHKELQERLVPDLLKHFKSWQAALHSSAEAISKVGDAWLRIADSVGRDSDWGMSFANLAEWHKKMEVAEQTWATALECKFVVPVTMTLAGEQKQTMAKEKDVKRALDRFENMAEPKKKPSKNLLTKKSSKKDSEFIASAMNRLSETAKDIEDKRILMWQDLQWHCSQSHFILLQALCITLKERCDLYDKAAEMAKQMKGTVDVCQKVYPDKSMAPKTDDLESLYAEEAPTDSKGSSIKSFISQRKNTRSKDSLLMRNKTLAMEGEREGDGKPQPIPTFSRREEAELRKTWAPQTHAKLSEAFSSLSSSSDVATKRTRSTTDLSSPRIDKEIVVPEAATAGTAAESGIITNSPSKGSSKEEAALMRVRAKWPFKAEREEELSMQVGDVFTITDRSNPNWWVAVRDGSKGLIPAPYVEFMIDEPDLPDEPPLPLNQLPLPSVTAAPPLVFPTISNSPRFTRLMPSWQPSLANEAESDITKQIEAIERLDHKPFGTGNDLPSPNLDDNDASDALRASNPDDSSLNDLLPPPLPQELNKTLTASAESLVTCQQQQTTHSPAPVCSEPTVEIQSPPPTSDMPNSDEQEHQIDASRPNATPAPSSVETGGTDSLDKNQEKENEVWEPYYTSEGHLYYYNPKTGDSKWG